MKQTRYYTLFISALLLLFSSCATRKQFTVKKDSRTPPAITAVPTQKDDAITYIERYKQIAIAEMNTYGIPASITLAQGLLESANGNSTLAIQANNHFGIKCTSGWSGETILKDDDVKDECFRVYKTSEESFRDHSEFLKRKRYAFLFELDRNDYEGWAKGLKKAGYATNPRYPELLTGLIRRYGLDQYDRKETAFEKSKRESKVFSEIAKELPEQRKDDVAKSPVIVRVYEVKQGDTIYSISKRFALSVTDLKTINGLQDDTIKLGQLLLLSNINGINR